MSKPLSETNRTLVDKAPVIWLNSLLDEEIDLIQSCTVDVAEHSKVVKLYGDSERERGALLADVERLKKEQDRIKNELITELASLVVRFESLKKELEELKKIQVVHEGVIDKSRLEIGIAEGERRAMERMRSVLADAGCWCVYDDSDDKEVCEICIIKQRLGLGEEEKR